MKKIASTLFLLLFAVATLFAQQSNNQAVKLLDKASYAFTSAGGVKIGFSISAPSGSLSGTLKLKNSKFYLSTPQMEVWFNGKTQWSYVKANEEVNVSNPDADELQHINPYAFLNLYKNGYTCTMGKKKVYSSRKINEVVLTAQDKKTSLKTINIYLDAKTNNPLFVSMQTNKGTTNIKISSYSAKQNFSDTLFNFNKRKYPKVDVVDLR